MVVGVINTMVGYEQGLRIWIPDIVSETPLVDPLH